MTARSKPSAQDSYAATIRESGLRVTQPRLAVMHVLDKHQGPLSHADLIDALAGQGFDRVTLYRNLNDLAEAGIVTRTEVGDHVWRFELRGRRERSGRAAAHSGVHPHFTCTDCGTVSCLPDDAVQINRSGRVPKAMRDHTVEVSLRGLCDRCS